MKIVTIRSKKTGEILIKILHRKSGVIDIIKTPEIDRDCDIDIRDNLGRKMIVGGWE